MTNDEMLVWRRLAPGKWEDAWRESLRFIAHKLVITAMAGARTIRLEAYGITRTEAKQLVGSFGGTLRTVNARKLAAASQAAGPPLRVRNQMLVTSSLEEMHRLAERIPGRKIIAIPAGLAFGTGEHPTTLNCLRFLADAARALDGVAWRFLDLGTGTGILAIAARALGAASVDAWDFDSQAVRVAKENVRENGATRIRVKRLDILKWTPCESWDVITANVYSEILIRVAPKIQRAIVPGGRLILSGILRSQESECLRAFEKSGFAIDAISRRGKWVAAAMTLQRRLRQASKAL